MLEEKYNNQIAEYEKSLQRYSRIFSAVGYLKLVIFILLVGSVIFTFSKGFSVIFCIVSLAILILFIYLLIYHEKIHQELNYSKGIIAINKQYLDRISGKWTEFADIGEEFIDIEHPFACDLDIVGKKSLFQLLNVTNTWHGRHTFANDLLSADYSEKELLLRQQSISELSEDIEFANKVQYHTSKIGTDSAVLNLIQELKDDKPFIKSKSIKNILTFCPIFTTVFVIVIMLLQMKNLYLIGVILAVIQSLIWAFGISKLNQYLAPVGKFRHKLSSYSKVLEIILDRNFSSKKLNEIKSQLISSNSSATKAIKELDKIVERVNVRHNVLLYFILNVFLLWDYECAFMLDEWRSKYAKSVESWFSALGEFESLLSFSNLSNVCNHVCFPVITKENQVMEASELGHPLILNGVRVNNNFSAGNRILIISGSNMSGKTTFLRTVGINLVLASAGSMVCAKQMTYSLMKIITSMRIADDLNEGISTFYAELKRIKQIIDTAQKNTNMIFLIDEIFRGTNSVDRLLGATTVISKLNALGVMGIITTHDLDLCKLANQNRIKNFSFSEYYQNNKIHFDYRIREGKSNTTNAKFLMEMIGIFGGA